MKSASPKLEQSNNYKLFVHHENQQPMSQLHVRRLASSMQKSGFLPSKPIQVYRRRDGKLVIIDGHHRFTAAMSIGIFIYYVIEPEVNSDLIGEENVLVRKWSSSSFVSLYASRGNEHFKTLLFYSQKIPLQLAASLLRGESAHSGNSSRSIRDGSFKVKTLASAETILLFFEKVGTIAPNIRKENYIEALSMLLFVEQFDINTLAKRIEANPLGIVPCANRIQALESLEQVYNFRSRQVVPLAFLAREKMRERNAASKGK